MKFLTTKNFASRLLLLSATLAAAAQTARPLGNLPLWFEAGQPQTFTACGRDSQFSISQTGADIILRPSENRSTVIHMKFVGANPLPAIAGEAELAGKISRLTGNNPALWRRGADAFTRVRLDGIYPGVGAVFYGNERALEYDFNLAADVNPDTIAIRFAGAEKISVNAQGELVIRAGGGEIIQHRPAAYQPGATTNRAVRAGYKILDANTVAFAVENYDRTLPLVIDPVLGCATFFGGKAGDLIHAIDLGADGSVYVAGSTLSSSYSNTIPITTPGAFQTGFSGGNLTGDAFVAKFDSTGTNLVYLTYLGGSANDAALGLAVDAAGDAFVTGYTESTNFPVGNALFPKISGVKNPVTGFFPVDAFVTELNPAGSALVYSTYLGGDAADIGSAIAVDPVSGNAFVTGYTYSTNFPVTADALQKKLACTNSLYVNANAFVAEIAAGGGSLNYSTYLGGTNNDAANAICFNNGLVFVAGQTASTNFPWTNGLAICRQLDDYTNTTKIPAATDGFVSVFAVDGTNLDLKFSTFLGGSNDDVITGIQVDAAGNADVTGWTTSTNFPNSTNGVQLDSFVRTNTAGVVVATNAFLTQLTFGTNIAIGYSQIFGGFGVDTASGLALDAGGDVFVVGTASSTNFPVTSPNIFGSLRATNSGQSDVFVTAFKSDFSGLLYSTYLGGRKNDSGNAIAVDSDGDAIVAGQTLSTNFPVLGTWPTNFPVAHRILDGTNDAFIAKILTGTSPVLEAAHAGTNVLVFWPAISPDINPTNLGIDTATNLLMTIKVITTTNNVKTTNFITTFNTNWVTVTNPAPVLTNGDYTYTFDPTNPTRFFRFHNF